MLTETRLAAIATAEAAATPGPWYAGGPPWGTGGMVYARSADPHAGTFVTDCQMQEMEEEAERIHSENIYADAAFIAVARQAVPDLLADVQRLRAQVGELERALDYARSIIESYQVDIRNSEWTGVDLVAVGFCQGSIYRNALDRLAAYVPVLMKGQ